jgi:hypothetical protein
MINNLTGTVVKYKEMIGPMAVILSKPAKYCEPKINLNDP